MAGQSTLGVKENVNAFHAPPPCKPPPGDAAANTGKVPPIQQVPLAGNAEQVETHSNSVSPLVSPPYDPEVVAAFMSMVSV